MAGFFEKVLQYNVDGLMPGGALSGDVQRALNLGGNTPTGMPAQSSVPPVQANPNPPAYAGGFFASGGPWYKRPLVWVGIIVGLVVFYALRKKV